MHESEAVGLRRRSRERIEVVWEGGASAAFQAASRPGPAQNPQNRRPYLLFVWPSICARISCAWCGLFCRAARQDPVRHSLVWSSPEASYAALRRRRSAWASGSACDPREVGQEELNALYREADLFVYSLPLEGFGLPMLAAMPAAFPVLAARASAFRRSRRSGALF